MEEMEGFDVMESGVPVTEIDTGKGPFVNVTSTVDAAIAVPSPTIHVIDVELTQTGDKANVPEPAFTAAPTLTFINALKYVPVTVIKLPMYAAAGVMPVAVGLGISGKDPDVDRLRMRLNKSTTAAFKALAAA